MPTTRCIQYWQAQIPEIVRVSRLPLRPHGRQPRPRPRQSDAYSGPAGDDARHHRIEPTAQSMPCSTATETRPALSFGGPKVRCVLPTAGLPCPKARALVPAPCRTTTTVYELIHAVIVYLRAAAFALPALWMLRVSSACNPVLAGHQNVPSITRRLARPTQGPQPTRCSRRCIALVVFSWPRDGWHLAVCGAPDAAPSSGRARISSAPLHPSSLSHSKPSTLFPHNEAFPKPRRAYKTFFFCVRACPPNSQRGGRARVAHWLTVGFSMGPLLGETCIRRCCCSCSTQRFFHSSY